MKAVVYKRGRGFQLIHDRKLPALKKDQVRVDVHAAAINPVDYKLPALIMHGKGVGMDLAGVIVAIGKEVTGFKVGDSIFGNCRGALAEQANCNVGDIAIKPAGLSFIEAAAMPTAYLTGYQALANHGFQSGHKLLVIGASGGCGTAGLQIGSAMGASEIVGICSQKNAQMVLSSGATSVVDYQTENPLERYGPGYFDFVYDTASSSGGGEAYQKMSRRLLKPKRPNEGIGMYVCLNGGLFAWMRTLGRLEGKTSHLIMTRHSRSDLESIISLMQPESATDSWTFKPIIDQVLNLDAESVSEGFTRLRSRRTRGKIVFRCTEGDAQIGFPALKNSR